MTHGIGTGMRARNRSRAAAVVAALIAAFAAAACSSPAIYEGAQAGRRLDCQKYPEPERTRCIESTPASWAEYQRARGAAR